MTGETRLQVTRIVLFSFLTGFPFGPPPSQQTPAYMIPMIGVMLASVCEFSMPKVNSPAASRREKQPPDSCQTRGLSRHSGVTCSAADDFPPIYYPEASWSALPSQCDNRGRRVASQRRKEALERPDDFQSTFQTFLCVGQRVGPVSVGVITQPVLR